MSNQMRSKTEWLMDTTNQLINRSSNMVGLNRINKLPLHNLLLLQLTLMEFQRKRIVCRQMVHTSTKLRLRLIRRILSLNNIPRKYSMLETQSNHLRINIEGMNITKKIINSKRRSLCIQIKI